MLSPITLPPEILSQIFHYATEGRLVIASCARRCIQLDIIHVCAHWREAAFGDASFWTTIDLHISINDALNGATIYSYRYISSLFAQAIHNARGSLLNLTVHLSLLWSPNNNSLKTAEGEARGQLPDNDPGFSQEVELATQIAATSPQWRVINLLVMTPRGIQFATSLMQARGSLQELQEAGIAAFDKAEFDFAPIIAAPSLQKLRCNWIDRLVFPSRLTNITIRVGLKSSVWIQSLLLCKSLRYIAVMGDGDWYDAGSPDSPEIVPTTLQHVVEFRTDSSSCFLKWLTLPSLTKLEVRWCPFNHTCLSLFLQRSACRLRTFSTSAVYISHDIHLLPMLCPLLDTVEHLSINASDVSTNAHPLLILLSILRDVHSLPLLHTVSIQHFSTGPPRSYFGVCSAVIALRDAIQARRETGRLQRVIARLTWLDDVLLEQHFVAGVAAHYFNALEDLQSWNANYDPAVGVLVDVIGSKPAQLVVFNDKHGSEKEHQIQWETSSVIAPR